MKPVLIKHDKVKEAQQCCEENIGSENRRWWTINAGAHWDGIGARFVYDTVFYFDVTENEEIHLTYVMMRWA